MILYKLYWSDSKFNVALAIITKDYKKGIAIINLDFLCFQKGIVLDEGMHPWKDWLKKQKVIEKYEIASFEDISNKLPEYFI